MITPEVCWEFKKSNLSESASRTVFGPTMTEYDIAARQFSFYSDLQSPR